MNRTLPTHSQSRTGESAVTFSIRGATEAEDKDFLRICAITGDSREIRATRGDRIVLSRQAETVYAAELLGDNRQWSGSIGEDELRSRFKLITNEWRAGDN